MKALILFIFALMCISQWYVPAAMIAGHEDVMRDGRVFRFKTAPVDPTDPFRGKYITLSFDADVFHHNGRNFETGEEVTVVLRENSAGFATIADIADSCPDSEHCFQTEVVFADEEIVRVDFPFDRFYLEESKASEAERLYWEGQQDTTQNVYAVVRIKSGKTVLEDVRINEQSIVDLVREMNKQ